MKIAAVALSVIGTVFGLVLGLSVIGSTGSASAVATPAETCATTGPLPELSDVAAANARVVTAVAERRGGTPAAVVAIMVGYTESGLRVLGNTTVGTGSLPTQGTGSDHDSLGIFQQRASWGTAAQRLDPTISTNLFLARLLATKDWQGKEPWVAGQDVQRSAWDGVPRATNHYSATYGGNYQAYVALAARTVRRIDADAAHLSCGALSGGLPANAAPGSHGLPAGYVVPATATPEQAKVVLFAIAQLDKPYVFAAEGPNAYDCSGLTLAAWRQVGVDLPHQAAAQLHEGTETTVGALEPGDLVLVPGDDGTLTAPGHVGIYIGYGLVLNAADERIGIRVQTYANFLTVGHGLAGLRHLA